jgi:hypothetical protein
MGTLCFVCFPPASLGHDVLLPHEPDNALSATMNPLFFELCMNARAPIDTPIFIKRIFNTHGQVQIIQLSLTDSSGSPIEVSIL